MALYLSAQLHSHPLYLIAELNKATTQWINISGIAVITSAYIVDEFVYHLEEQVRQKKALENGLEDTN